MPQQKRMGSEGMFDELERQEKAQPPSPSVTDLGYEVSGAVKPRIVPAPGMMQRIYNEAMANEAKRRQQKP